DTPPEAPFGFAQDVLRAIRINRLPLRLSLAEQLSPLFPRVAFAAILIVGMCAAADIYINERDTSLTAAVEQVAADEWLVAGR
ncbi:MAG: hypothetical protein ACK4UN_04600, partial [Limisphaerales bacterium]